MSLQVYSNTTAIPNSNCPVFLPNPSREIFRRTSLIDPTAPGNRLLQNHRGEVVLLERTPAEVVGERVLRPLLDKVHAVVTRVYVSLPSVPFSSPSLLPVAHAAPIAETSSVCIGDHCQVAAGSSETHLTDLLAEAKAATVGSSVALAKTDELFDELLSSPDQLAHLNGVDIQDLRDSRGYNLFLAAAQEGNAAAVTTLLRHTELIHAVDGAGRTALHIAAQRGDTVLIPQLARHISLQSKDFQGLTPLHHAIHEEQPKAVETLLEAGVSLSEVWKTPERNRVNPLSMAVIVGNAETVQVMIKHDVFKKVDLSQTVHGIGNLLHLAIRANQAPMLEYLLTSEEVRRLMGQPDPQGRTPLQLAASLGDLNAIYLLHKQGVLLNDGEGEERGTAVHYAAEGYHADALELLYNLGANIVADNKDGKTPLALLEGKDGAEAKTCRARIEYLRGARRIEVTRPPNFARRPPYNLVFAGGGPRGLAHLGALRKLEQTGAIKEVKRVAGTSAGAILSSLISVGYDSRSLEPHLSRNFAELLDPHHVLEKALIGAAKEKSLETLSKYWEYLQSKHHLPEKLLVFFLDMFRISHTTGLCSGEELREWVDQLIQEATKSAEHPEGIKHCTFKELHNLRRKNPDKYKDLHVFAIRVTKEKVGDEVFGIPKDLQKTDVVRFNYEEGGIWNDLVISDAVRASASIPVVFKLHILHFKDETGTRHPVEHHGRFMDGGLVRNYPIDAFDDEKYQEDPFIRGEKTNRRTLGLTLETAQETVQSIPNNPGALARAMIYTYYHAEELLQRENPHHKDRTVSISVKGVGLLDFDASAEKKEEMIAAGESAVGFFLTPHQGKA